LELSQLSGGAWFLSSVLESIGNFNCKKSVTRSLKSSTASIGIGDTKGGGVQYKLGKGKFLGPKESQFPVGQLGGMETLS